MLKQVKSPGNGKRDVKMSSRAVIQPEGNNTSGTRTLWICAKTRDLNAHCRDKEGSRVERAHAIRQRKGNLRSR